MTTLGVVAAVKAAVAEDTDYYTLYLAGRTIMDFPEWRNTPHSALTKRSSADQADAFDMSFYVSHPEFSPRVFAGSVK